MKQRMQMTAQLKHWVLGLVMAIVTMVVGQQVAIAATSRPVISCQQLVSRILQDHRSYRLKPTVLQLAITAYQRAVQAGIALHKPIITLIDYSLPSNQKRLWVIDLRQGQILYHSLVAHGKNSGYSCWAKRFNE